MPERIVCAREDASFLLLAPPERRSHLSTDHALATGMLHRIGAAAFKSGTDTDIVCVHVSGGGMRSVGLIDDHNN